MIDEGADELVQVCEWVQSQRLGVAPEENGRQIEGRGCHPPGLVRVGDREAAGGLLVPVLQRPADEGSDGQERFGHQFVIR